MNHQTWLRARALFEVLADLPPVEREAIIDAECRDDDILRDQLKGLLRADSAGQRIMDGGAFALYSFLVMDHDER